MEEKIVTMITEQDTDGGNKQLSLNLLITRTPNVTITVYSSYWLINKTGLPLQIRVNNSLVSDKKFYFIIIITNFFFFRVH